MGLKAYKSIGKPFSYGIVGQPHHSGVDRMGLLVRPLP
jgi:hypothetical protein